MTTLFDQPRDLGTQAADACLATAERIARFDTDGARQFVTAYLGEHGVTSGEELVDRAKAAGFVGHDDRCFGAVFATLAKRGVIRCAGYGQRSKGHGSAGLRLWELA